MTDIKFAFRQLLKNPGFTTVAVLTLALGIGANTAIFSIVNAVLMKMLPVANPQALVLFSHAGKNAPADGPAYQTNFPMYEFLRDHCQSFAGLFAFTSEHLRVLTDGEFQGVSGELVTPNYFSVLGVEPVLGRTWKPDDETNPSVVVISHRFWRRYFGASPAVVGKTLVVNGKPLTVIGVTPPGFLGMTPGEPADLTVLLAAQPWLLPEQGNLLKLGDGDPLEAVAATWPLFIMGRLADGVTMPQAQAEMSVQVRNWTAGKKTPDWLVERDLYRALLEPGGKGLDTLRKRFARTLWMLTGVVGCVFLIACANIANLLLARATSRGQEMAVRLAIGASRTRLIRQLLTESLLLTLLGGLCGIVFGWWGSSLLNAFIASGRMTVDVRTDPDWRVLALTATLSVIAGIGVGLVPALRASAVSLTPGLKGNALGSIGHGRRWGLSRTLVAAQLALSLCLLVGTGLFVSSLNRITSIDPGFRMQNLWLINFDWSGAGYDSAKMLAFGERAINRVKELPGVSAASATFLEPLGEEQSFTHFSVPGVPAHGAVERNIVWPDYLKTMGIPLVRGREFNEHDGADAPKVTIINETLAKLYFGETDPIGKSVWLARQPSGSPVTIVGVARDSTQRDLRDAPVQLVYLPYSQIGHGARTPTLLVRGDGGAPISAEVLRQALREVSSDISVRDITTPENQVERGLLRERLLARLTGFFGPVAMLLAAIGLYGMLAYEVAQRTREIGVHMALGASRWDVLLIVLKQGVLLVVIGSVIGIGASSFVGRLVRGLLFDIGPNDPATLITAITVLGLVALIACWLPARRAALVDPIVALRNE